MTLEVLTGDFKGQHGRRRYRPDRITRCVLLATWKPCRGCPVGCASRQATRAVKDFAHARVARRRLKTGPCWAWAKFRGCVTTCCASWPRSIDIVTMGQYLRPSKSHLPLALLSRVCRAAQYALALGIPHVVGPLVRSSYHADEAKYRPGARPAQRARRSVFAGPSTPTAAADTAARADGGADIRR